MKWATYGATFLGGLVACYLLFALGVIDRVDKIPGTQAEPDLSISTYLSFVSVMMTAVTAVLAALAIGIGIIAAYTFKELKEEARSVAESTSKQVAKAISQSTAIEVSKDALSEAKLKPMLLEMVKTHQQEKEWGTDPNDNEER